MVDPGPPRRATRADLEALPAHLKGELIDGVLYATPRPRAQHQVTAANILVDLQPLWQRGRGGPGGWWIVPEPGLMFGGAEDSPDLAGWKRERMPALPRDSAFTVVPDWVCEILSPRTRRHDLLVKSPFYAGAGVAWMWLVDLDARVITTFRNEHGAWVVAGTFGDETDARMPPFDATPVDLTPWWAELAE